MNYTGNPFDKAIEGVSDYEQKETAKLLIAFRYVLENIDYPSIHIKEYLREGRNFHVGFCKVFEEDNYKNSSYPGYRFYSVVEEDNEEYHIPRLLMRQDDNSEDSFHCLVWQTTTCCEDDYQGFILFPLTGGIYWIVKFEF